MARRMETGLGSWAALVLLLVSSSVVLGLEWNKECDGGLRNWLLTTVVVTAICGVLGALFHGRGDGTRPSRFLDEDDDDIWGVDDDSVGVSVSSSGAGGVEARGMGAGSTGNNNSSGIPGGAGEGGGRGTPVSAVEEGRIAREARGAGAEATKGGAGGGGPAQEGERRDSMGEDSIVSGVPSTISYRLASHSSSLQHRYFGPGPKVFPDAIFFILVVSQWFLAGWSVVGAALYFRLFNGNRTCSPLLRHWTLLVVIIGFLSCLLAVCYSGIMCCMLGTPFSNRRRNGGSEGVRFQGDVPSSSDGTAGSGNNPDLM